MPVQELLVQHHLQVGQAGQGSWAGLALRSLTADGDIKKNI
jgi:hypothetical protein